MVKHKAHSLQLAAGCSVISHPVPQESKLVQGHTLAALSPRRNAELSWEDAQKSAASVTQNLLARLASLGSTQPCSRMKNTHSSAAKTAEVRASGSVVPGDDVRTGRLVGDHTQHGQKPHHRDLQT